MKARMGSFLIGILLLSACTPTYQAYLEEARSAAHYSNLGMRAARKGKYEQAIPLFHKALEIDPHLMVAREQLALAHHSLGNKYLEWRQYAMASTHFRLAISIDPSLGIARQGLKTAARRLQLSALEHE